MVFVATDDFRAVPELSAMLGTDYDVVTLATSSDRGNDENSFNGQSPGAKWREFVTFWATLELLARSDLFVGRQESNVFRVAHLMRLGRPANSSVSVSEENEGAGACESTAHQASPVSGSGRGWANTRGDRYSTPLHTTILGAIVDLLC